MKIQQLTSDKKYSGKLHPRSTFQTRNATLFAILTGLVALCCAVFPPVSRPTTASVVSYLVRAELKEPDVWFADDYRISRLCVGYAAQGIDDPWGYAFWTHVGVTFEKFPQKLEALRRAQLGREYAAWHGDGAASSGAILAAASSPKKPVQSERRKYRRAA